MSILCPISMIRPICDTGIMLRIPAIHETKFLKVVLEGYHRYFFGVKVKTAKKADPWV